MTAEEGKLYKNHNKAGRVGEDTPFSSLLLPSDPMLLMPICQNQLENRRQEYPKNPLHRVQPPEAQSRIGKGGNWSGEGGKQNK